MVGFWMLGEDLALSNIYAYLTNYQEHLRCISDIRYCNLLRMCPAFRLPRQEDQEDSRAF